VGAISWLAVWFVLNTIFLHAGFAQFGAFRIPSVSLADLDPVALALAALALVLTFVLKRSMLQVIGICAVLGVLAKIAGLA
jgi:chromate transporter